jgi:hypothetical protein
MRSRPSWSRGGTKSDRIEAAECETPPATSVLPDQTRSPRSLPFGIHRCHAQLHWDGAARRPRVCGICGRGLAVWSLQSNPPADVEHLQVALDPEAPLGFGSATPASAISPRWAAAAICRPAGDRLPIHIEENDGPVRILACQSEVVLDQLADIEMGKRRWCRDVPEPARGRAAEVASFGSK